jgi:hypothetical protein
MNTLTLSSPALPVQSLKDDPFLALCAETETPVAAHVLAANRRMAFARFSNPSLRTWMLDGTRRLRQLRIAGANLLFRYTPRLKANTLVWQSQACAGERMRI